MNLFHHTLANFGVSLLLPVGYFPTQDSQTVASVEKLVDPEDLSPDNPELSMSMRRWLTNDITEVSTEMCSHFHLYEFADAHRWTSDPQFFFSDGVQGSIQEFACHGGDLGFIATFDLINEIVTFRATWPAEFPNFGGIFRDIVQSARYLLAGDVMSEKTSVLQPLIGVSIVPDEWFVDEPEIQTLRVVRNNNAWVIHQVDKLPVLDDSWVEIALKNDTFYDPVHLYHNPGQTALVGLLEGLRPYLIEGLVEDPADFEQLIQLSESVRIHPPIDWHV